MYTYKNRAHIYCCKHGSMQAIAKNICLRIILQSTTTQFDHITILEQKTTTPMCLCTKPNKLFIP